MLEFEAANRHRIAFTAISGGLFTGERAGPISAYPHIPEANARIAQMTGAHFGEAYRQLLEKGTMVMDSTHAAAALGVLRYLAPDKAVLWAHQLQEAFYDRGRSLSDPNAIAEIAQAGGLDAAQVLSHLEDGSALRLAQSDFALARRYGVASYPTLLFVEGSNAHPLPATGATLEVLNKRLDALLN